MTSFINVLVYDDDHETEDEYDPAQSNNDNWKPLRGDRTSQDSEHVPGGRVARFSEIALKETLQPLVASLSSVFSSLGEVEGMTLSKISVGVEISAEGGFVLIGSGKLGSKGAISLSFDVPSSNDKPDT